jgi:hypothetical protein
LAGASKIAPHGESLLAERNVFSIEFVECHNKEEFSLYTGTIRAMLIRIPPTAKRMIERLAKRKIEVFHLDEDEGDRELRREAAQP